MFECLFDSCCLFHDCLAGCLSVLTVVSGLRFERCLSVNTRPKVLINTTAFIHIAIALELYLHLYQVRYT